MGPGETIVKWPCYEPPGYTVELTAHQLLQHVLLLGATGSGKTTLLSSAIRQLLCHRSQSEPIGLLILDAKVDGIVDQVREDARAVGRHDDVMVFGPEGDYAFDFFSDLRSLDDVERTTRQLLLGVERFGGDNMYWEQASSAMISAALVLYLASGQRVYFEGAIEWMRKWFFTASIPPRIVELAVAMKKRRRLHPCQAAALDQIEIWKTLDPRTKSNLQSCLALVSRGYSSPAAARCFSRAGRLIGTPAQAAAEGRICVVSVSALREPSLARFFFRLAKESFFDCVQLRKGTNHPLCGILMDEFPLVTTFSDVEQMGTIRSKCAFAIAATQSIDSLIHVLGATAARAVINHFNSVLFLRTREMEASMLAYLSLGMRSRRRRIPGQQLWDLGHTAVLPSHSYTNERSQVPIAPIGSLGRLRAHQAFVMIADESPCEEPVWFVPWFEIEPPNEQPKLPATNLPFQFAYTERLMRSAGFKRLWSAAIVAAAVNLCRSPKAKSAAQELEVLFSRLLKNGQFLDSRVSEAVKAP